MPRDIKTPDQAQRRTTHRTTRRRVVGAVIGGSAGAVLGQSMVGATTPGRLQIAAVRQEEDLPIVIGTLGDASTINPLRAGDSEAEWRCKILFDEFVRIDPVTYAPVPGIAAKWEIKDLVITFTLQPDVKFSDGSALTADDVAFTIKGFLAKETASPKQSKFLAIAGAAEYAGGTATDVTGIKVIDPGTIEFTLAKPDAPFIYNMRFAWILPKAKLDGKNLVDDPYFQAPVGAGPFMLESWEGNDFVTVRNPNFWETNKPVITRMTHRLIADSQTLVLALQGSEIDGSNYPNPAGREVLEQNPDLDLVVPPFASPNGWFFNCRHELLGKKEVRRAIAMGLNCEQFAADSLLGLSKAGLGPIAPDSWAFDPSLAPIPYDPVTAKQMIIDAGAEGAQIKFAVNSGNILREDWLTYTQQALTEIGIEVVPELVDYATHDELVKQSHEFEVSGVDFAGVTDEPSTLWDQFYSTSSGNYSGLNSPELDALLDEAKSTIDQEAAIPIYASIQKLIMDEVPMHFAWYRPFLYAINKAKFANYKPSGPFGAFYFLQDWTAVQP